MAHATTRLISTGAQHSNNSLKKSNYEAKLNFHDGLGEEGGGGGGGGGGATQTNLPWEWYG